MLREGIPVRTRESLQRWGWCSYFEALWNEGERENAVPARVIAQQRKFWRIAGAFGEGWAEASGKLRLAGEEGVEWPRSAIGCGRMYVKQEAPALILEVLPRRSRFVRKMAGKKIRRTSARGECWTRRLLVSALDGILVRGAWNDIWRSCWEAGANR